MDKTTHQRHLTVLHPAVDSQEGVVFTLQRTEKVDTADQNKHQNEILMTLREPVIIGLHPGYAQL